MSVGVLRDRMTQLYDASGPTSWPNPHPDSLSPADEEYSRCLEPAKYRIIGLRAEAWATALVDAGVADRADAPAGPDEYWPSRTVTLRPRRGGAADLRFVLSAANGVTDSGVRIECGDAGTTLARIPACGCDACDDGSSTLLDEIDDIVDAVISGTVRVARGANWNAVARRPGEREASGTPSLPDDAEIRRRLGDDRAVCGAPWFAVD